MPTDAVIDYLFAPSGLLLKAVLFVGLSYAF